MQRLEVSGAVRPIYASLGFKGLKELVPTTGSAVTQLVKTLRYKPEGRGFDPP